MQRIDAFEYFKNVHPSIVKFMKNICDEASLWSKDSVIDARGLLTNITTTDFLSALVITQSVLAYLRGITSSLKGEAKYIIEAVDELNTVKSTLQLVRDDVETHYNEWLKSSENMALEIDVEVTLPRLCRRQINRTNILADSLSNYYLRCIAIPLLDHLIQEMGSRFGAIH